MSIFDGTVVSVMLVALFCLYVRIPRCRGNVKSVLENGVIGLANRILMSRLRARPREADSLCSPDAVRTYLALQLAERPFEVFCCLYLDNKHRAIEFKEMFTGTIDAASVYPREIVRHCIEVNAAAVILAHNHPSGDPNPSPADQAITRRIQSALELIDVRLLDHFIVGGIGDEIVSFAERGLI